MSQSSMNIAAGSGAAVRAAINAAIQSLASNNAGPSAPTTTYAGMWWADTTNGLLKQRNSANTAWIVIWKLDVANLGLLPLAGGNMAGAINEALAPAVASAATPDIWSGAGNTVHITGTTAISGFAAAPQAGARRTLVFDGALTLTAGKNLVLPGGANISTIAGDACEVIAETTTQFRVVMYTTKASGQGSLAGFTAVTASTELTTAQLGNHVQIGGSTPTGQTITLPDFTGLRSGLGYWITNNSLYAQTIKGNGSQNILTTVATNTITLYPGETAFVFVQYGAQWCVFGTIVALSPSFVCDVRLGAETYGGRNGVGYHPGGANVLTGCLTNGDNRITDTWWRPLQKLVGGVWYNVAIG